jgi:hypothetical protein
MATASSRSTPSGVLSNRIAKASLSICQEAQNSTRPKAMPSRASIATNPVVQTTAAEMMMMMLPTKVCTTCQKAPRMLGLSRCR